MFTTVLLAALSGCQSTPSVRHPVCDDIYSALGRGDILDQTLNSLVQQIEQEIIAELPGNTHYHPLRLKAELSVVDPAFNQGELSADDYRRHYNQQVKFALLMNRAAKPHDNTMLWEHYENRLNLYPCEGAGHKIPCHIVSEKRLQLEKELVTDPVSGSRFYRTMLSVQQPLKISTRQIIGQELDSMVSDILKKHYSHHADIVDSVLEALVVTGHIHYTVYTMPVQRNWYDADIHYSVDTAQSRAWFPARVLVIEGIKGRVHLDTQNFRRSKCPCPMQEAFKVDYEIPDSTENSVWLLGGWYQPLKSFSPSVRSGGQ